VRGGMDRGLGGGQRGGGYCGCAKASVALACSGSSSDG
jgi:hypothetical protein